MDMPDPMAQTTYDQINSELHNAYFGTALESLEKAAHEICDLESQKLDDTASTTDIDSILDTKVSGDGAWQKRGHSSLNSVVTLIGNGQCMQKMFGRSANLHSLQYTFYIEDGDTKLFDQICKSDPYPGYTIKKGECVGHVQKRVGSDFAISRAKGKSFLTAKISMVGKDT